MRVRLEVSAFTQHASKLHHVEKDLVDYNFGARSQRDMECLNGIPRAIIVDYNRELHKSLNYSYNSF